MAHLIVLMIKIFNENKALPHVLSNVLFRLIFMRLQIYRHNTMSQNKTLNTCVCQHVKYDIETLFFKIR